MKEDSHVKWIVFDSFRKDPWTTNNANDDAKNINMLVFNPSPISKMNLDLVKIMVLVNLLQDKIKNKVVTTRRKRSYLLI